MRALLLLLDAPGCSSTPAGGAARYGQPSAAPTLNELFHTHPEVALPALDALGWWKIVTGDVLAARSQGTQGRWGRLRPNLAGADFTTLVWELAGVERQQPFATFDAPPEELVKALAKQTGTDFLVLPAGSALEEWLAEHATQHKRGKKAILRAVPGESALELLADTEVVPLEQLLVQGRRLRSVADAYRVARIRVQPFALEKKRPNFTTPATTFPVVPPRTILNALADAGLTVHGLGPVPALFGNSGITVATPFRPERDPLAQIETAWANIEDGLIIAALPAPETVATMALRTLGIGLEEFDTWLQSFIPRVEVDDLFMLAAVPQAGVPAGIELPISVLHRGEAGPLGTRRVLADAAATFSEYFKLRHGWPVGESFFRSPLIGKRSHK